MMARASQLTAESLTHTRDFAMPATGYVAEVDGLRWLAVSLVMAYHAGLAPFGWSGVWVFFVISGFAVTMSLSASAGRPVTAGTVLRHFYIRRCLRIWPLYYGFLAVNVVVLMVVGWRGPLALVPWLATFSYNIALALARLAPRFNWAPFGPLWTLAVEEQFYLLYPLLFLALSRRGLAESCCWHPSSGGNWAICCLTGVGTASKLRLASIPSHQHILMPSQRVACWRSTGANWSARLYCCVLPRLRC